MEHDALAQNSETQPENTNATPNPQPAEIEINYGRITYLSEEKGAFVELITDADQSTLRTVSQESSQKLEVFVPKELIAEKKNLARDLLVQLKRIGDTIVDIEPF